MNCPTASKAWFGKQRARTCRCRSRSRARRPWVCCHSWGATTRLSPGSSVNGPGELFYNAPAREQRSIDTIVISRLIGVVSGDGVTQSYAFDNMAECLTKTEGGALRLARPEGTALFSPGQRPAGTARPAHSFCGLKGRNKSIGSAPLALRARLNNRAPSGPLRSEHRRLGTASAPCSATWA